jgi:gliding motility-associated-like protein
MCNATSFTLAANAPTVGTGRWTTIYGTRTVANPASPTSTITVAPGDSIVLRWTVTNGTCAPSFDDVTLVSYRQPTTAAAGPDQKLCNVTSFTLAANAPTVGTGRWTTIYGTRTVANPTSPNSTITVAPGDSIVLRWTVTNGNCAPSFDDVTLVSYRQPTTAAAGPDQRMCNVTSFTLAGNIPTVGTGRWTVVYGTANIAAPANPVTSVTVAPGDSVILRWTISNGTCAASSDLVTLVNYRAAAAAAAGPDQKLCNVNTFSLSANAPSVPSATGRWTIVYGTPTLSSMTDPRATVTVAIGDSVVLRWTITNGACAPSSDDVILVSYQQAAIATAGPDQKMCNVANFTMAANAPGVATATGTWTRVYGNATIANVNSPTTTVTVAAGDSVVLRWTITNGPCPVTSDDVVLVNNRPPTVAAAGPDQQQCGNGAFTLAANAATVGTGRWTIVSGTATIANINSPTSTVTVPAGGTVTLRWTIANGICPPTTDDVTLANLNPVLGNTISADQMICLNEPAAPLGGGTLTGGNGTYTYQWQSSTVSATTGFTNIPGATNATYSPGTLTQDSIWFRRIVNSGPCMNNISNAVKIIVITRPPVVVFVPGPLTVNCKLGMDYSTLFGTPQFSHAPYTGEPLTITFRDGSTINGCVRTFTRTWTATDRCGMTTTASQTITVVDNQAPEFNSAQPADITVNCDAIPAPVNLTAYDSCFGTITVTPTETRQNITGACANNYRLIRTWTATDGCNNSSTLTQIITVQDTTRPVFTVAPPRDTTVNCNSVPAAATLTATDNCTPGMITVTSTDVRQNIPGAQCADYYQIIRTWTARDECGNTATVRQTITVQDTTRPVFSIPQPANVTVDCDRVPAWPVVTATDNCSANVQVVTNETRTATLPACANNYRLIRTWTARDNCGNTATMQQIITVQDTTRPVFTVRPPADTMVSCDAVPPPPNNIAATDNCAGRVTISRSQIRQDIPGACASNYRLIRTWTATDECGNTTTVRQVITVADTTRPVIAPAPVDLVLSCGEAIPAPATLTATDNCDPAFPRTVTAVEDPYVKDVCAGYTIIRRWRVADACGNQAIERVQRIVVNPCPKPVLDPALPMNCSDNPTFTLQLRNQVNNPTYILVGVTPANAIQVPLAQKSATFNLNNATQASFIVQDGVTGCISDTVVYNLQYSNKPMVNLGNDTAICGGNSLILDAGAANFGYTIRWSTGETTQRIQISTGGTYWVSVTNGVCVTTDTIHVELIPMPLVNLPDASICRGQSVKLDAFVDGAAYLWSTGATTASILVSTQEQFWVRVTKRGCITIDTVNVTVNPPPDISLNRDTTICPDQSIMLTVNVNNGGSIRWATGATTSSIVVNEPGLYWVTVTRDNCMVRDTVNVRLQPGINVELGPNREICPGSSITIDGTTRDAISYLWDDGDSNPVKAFNATGKYRLAVMDRFCQRVYMDSLNVRVNSTPFIDLGNDTMMCIGETLRLRADGSNITRVLWSDGSTGPFLDVTRAGTYSVTVFNDCGSYTDQITVDYTQCDPKPTFPNAFTPNNDGRNDYFRPVVRGPMYEYELRIFNRWGELIYLGRDSKKGWDGRYQGEPVGVGTYVWWLTYKKMPGGNPNIIKGEVTVIR